MPTYVALLRGINVGRNKRMAMADLRELLTSLGHGGVRTLLNSGNAVFTSDRSDGEALAAELEEAISGRFGFTSSVLVRTREELAAVVEANPIPEATREPSRYLLTFLSAGPEPEQVAAVDPAAYEPERFAIGERVVYAWCANGVLASRLPVRLWERPGVVATARTWTTVTKLLALAGG